MENTGSLKVLDTQTLSWRDLPLKGDAKTDNYYMEKKRWLGSGEACCPMFQVNKTDLYCLDYKESMSLGRALLKIDLNSGFVRKEAEMKEMVSMRGCHIG